MFVAFNAKIKSINKTNTAQNNSGAISVPIDKKRVSLGESIGMPASTQEQEIVKINSLASDKEKIVEYNKKHANSNYIIVDKTDCSAIVYDKNGKVLKKFEVGLGMDIGDKKAGGYNSKIASEIKKYTAPGEYTLGEQSNANDKKYGSNLFILEGDGVEKGSINNQVAAIHQIPTTRLAQRKGLFKNGTISDNRMSFGCINMLAEDFDEMEKYINGTKTKLYVLPEEKDNKLQLEPQVDGSFKFVQTKYKDE